MLDTAHGTVAPNTDATDDPTATRPYRLLVPTERRSRLFLPDEDTLRAHDWGITRHTTDDELAAITADAQLGDDRQTDLRRLRNALAQPRDIDEANDWGLIVPSNQRENSEESLADPNKRLGWWWVYDPNRAETREERTARYAEDHRMVDTKGLARLLCRAYYTVKDLKAKSAWARGILDDEGFRAAEAAEYIQKHPQTAGRELSLEEAARAVVDRANFLLLKPTPPPVNRAGQSDLFDVAAALAAGRRSEHLNEWFVFNVKKQTGRPLGSRTRRPHAAL